MRELRIAIVGAGIVGLSTAYALLMNGIKHVTVLEQDVVDHPRATSHGPSRLLRFEYGAEPLYSDMVRLSLNRWRHLEQISKHTLYTRTGVLALGLHSDNFTLASHETLRDLGIPNENLPRELCQQRFPQFATHNLDIFTYNAEGGILHASTCLLTLKELIKDLGGTIIEHCAVSHINHENLLRPIHLHLRSGEELASDRVVVAAGPWVHKLLGELRLPVSVTRQHVLFFANLPQSRFGINAFPSFITNDDLYGFPIHNVNGSHGPAWFKAASHSFGTPVDPEDAPVYDERLIAQTVRRLSELLPALHQADLVRVDACMYDVTPDGDFIIDRLPHDGRIIFATGLTGHGFKFGPLLGELLSSMVDETDPPISLDRFQLDRFSHHHLQQSSSVA